NTPLRDADPAAYDRILDSISYLCWGEGEDADRIDDLLDPDSPRYVRGLGESVIMKLLAITHPDRYIAVFPYSGPNGKRRMLAALGLEQPSGDRSGGVQVEAYARLRGLLDRLFPNDPGGVARFLY